MMGNYKSRPSSDKESPSYNYHEEVLRDAQEGLVDTATPDCVVVDEEYYSAEEGDSILSVTPERTRPESSSAGSSSDNSDEDDHSVESCSQEDLFEESSFVSEEELHSPAEAFTSSVDSQADETCQNGYSPYSSQEQQSLKMQLEKTDRRSKSCGSLKDKTGVSQDITFNCRGSSSSLELIEHTFSMAKYASPLNKQSEMEKGDSESNECVLRSKEDVSQLSKSHSSESVLLANRMLIARSLKRKRMEYLMSSESENESEDSKSHKLKKYRKISSKRRNRSRHIRYSRNRRKSVCL